MSAHKGEPISMPRALLLTADHPRAAGLADYTDQGTDIDIRMTFQPLGKGACETPLSKASIARALRPANSGFDFDDDDDEVVFG